MKISIVTVTYNSAVTLRDTMESVLAQTYKEIEYIVVDGASKDGTVNIIREYEPKFEGRMRWVSEKDRGLYDAMNKGFRMAIGDVIGIINSDDLLAEPQAIEKVMNVFMQNKHADAVYADLFYVAQHD
ncbi:MAG: glycosyltransferase, partial [Bacteroidales bacterium]|nr:glycosyltransferase [Bacteroidales bacterium]